MKVHRVWIETEDGDWLEIYQGHVDTNLDPDTAVKLVWEKMDHFRAVREAMQLKKGVHMVEALRGRMALSNTQKENPDE